MVMDEIIQGDHRTKKGEESRNRKRNTEQKGSSLKAFSSNRKVRAEPEMWDITESRAEGKKKYGE